MPDPTLVSEADVLMDSEEIAQTNNDVITLLVHPPEGKSGMISQKTFRIDATVGEVADWYARKNGNTIEKYTLWKIKREMQRDLTLKVYINLGTIKNDDHTMSSLLFPPHPPTNENSHMECRRNALGQRKAYKSP